MLCVALKVLEYAAAATLHAVTAINETRLTTEARVLRCREAEGEVLALELELLHTAILMGDSTEHRLEQARGQPSAGALDCA